VQYSEIQRLLDLLQEKDGEWKERIEKAYCDSCNCLNIKFPTCKGGVGAVDCTVYKLLSGGEGQSVKLSEKTPAKSGVFSQQGRDRQSQTRKLIKNPGGRVWYDAAAVMTIPKNESGLAKASQSGDNKCDRCQHHDNCVRYAGRRR
jgi:hypothetical protein